MRQVQEALKNIGIPVIAGIWRATSENQNPPLQYVVYSSTTTETAFQDDRPAGYRTYIYLNLWSDIDPTDMANRIRQAIRIPGPVIQPDCQESIFLLRLKACLRTGYAHLYRAVDLGLLAGGAIGRKCTCRWNCRALIT